MAALIGIEIGTTSTALCVVQPEWRDSDAHFLVRRLERLPPGTSCVALAQRYTEIVERLATKTDLFVKPYFNATQAGPPIVEAFQKLTEAWNLQTIYFNHGPYRTVGEDKSIQLGKAWLVSHLKVLLQCGRLHLVDTPEARTLRQELRDYRPNLPDDAPSRYGAFRVGSQDDLINAIGLAVQENIVPLSPEDEAAIDEAFSGEPMTECGAIMEMYRMLGL